MDTKYFGYFRQITLIFASYKFLNRDQMLNSVERKT